MYEDKSLFKAQGPVWHESVQQQGYILESLRNLDTDATWSKSAYHGWVYGYGLHVTSNHAGFPKLAQVEAASVSESQVIEQKECRIIHQLCPETLTGDNGYTQASRIRRWAKENVSLLTPALKWDSGRYAKAYHEFIKEPENANLLRHRRTTIEPVFDLAAKIINAVSNQKQLHIRRLANVRTCLLTIQIAMIVNSIWNLPLRNISWVMAFFK